LAIKYNFTQIRETEVNFVILRYKDKNDVTSQINLDDYAQGSFLLRVKPEYATKQHSPHVCFGLNMGCRLVDSGEKSSSVFWLWDNKSY